jgi:hypothetical protein
MKNNKHKKQKTVLSGDTIEIKQMNGNSTFLKKTKPIGNRLEDSKHLDGEYAKSIDDFLEKRKYEVPLYDPQTGEPNPKYEKLTGKKNPLLNAPRLLNQSFKEYKQKNRFLVNLPKEFGIDIWDIKFTNRPTIYLTPKKFLGITYGYKKMYSEINIEINEGLQNNNNILLNLLEDNHKFNFEIEEVDPTGIVINKFNLYDCYITYLSFGDLDYKSNEINNIMLSISIGRLEIK